MLLASSDLRAVSAVRRRRWQWRLGALLQLLAIPLAVAALLALGAAGSARLRAAIDDLRYGWPRTAHADAFLGHAEARGTPTHLMAMNLNRRVVLVEFPGGDVSAPKVQVGPYLFGAQGDRTPVRMDVRDMDGDGALDVVLDIDSEWLVYLNKDGGFRLPTDDEQRRIAQRADRERSADGTR